MISLIQSGALPSTVQRLSARILQAAILVCSSHAWAAGADAGQQLEARFEHFSAQQQNVVGVVATHLESGLTVSLNSEVSFPMASTYKVAMAAYGLSLVDSGKLALDQMVPVEDRQRVVSSALTTYLPYSGVELSLQNLMYLMLTESDNTATDVFLETIGGAAAVTAWLRRIGIEDMRVDRSTAQLLRQYAGLPEPEPGVSAYDQYMAARGTPGIESFSLGGGSPQYLAFEQDPQDQATPQAMNALLVRLWKGELLSAASTQVLQDIMLRCNTGSARIKGLLPAGTPVAHKTGTIAGTFNDTGVISLPNGKGHLVMTVYIKNAVGNGSDHERVIAEMARTAYDYFALAVDDPGE